VIGEGSADEIGADELAIDDQPRGVRMRRGIPLRAILPNAITALALCSGLFGMRYGIAGEWGMAVGAVVLAAVLDGLDGRIARLLNGASRFGAELDSLSDVTAFGVAPAIIVYQFVLYWLDRGTDSYEAWTRFGWLIALAYAVCMAMRLARFNARIDVEDQPHKSAGFLTGVPAPVGAGLLLLPIYLWLASNREWSWLTDWRLVAVWTACVAALVISNLATFSWTSLRPGRDARLGAIIGIALLGAALATAPWETLTFAALLYLATIPFSILAYSRVKRQRAAAALPAHVEEPAGPAG
jgi:CDP-diacylglycerol--serine O-phosphatidyltransferase